MKKKIKTYYALCTVLCVLASCNGYGSTGSGVSYSSNSGLPCPVPLAIPQNVTNEFQRHANDPLMMNFYMHYMMQQRNLAGYARKDPATPHCPPSFWVEDSVADTFRDYPQGHPMREFFKVYVEQQRNLDKYYAPNAQGVR